MNVELNTELGMGESAASGIDGPIGDAQVTVVCITYNHEQFIAQALDSFLSQKTSFKFVVYVGDDCSEDSTSSIVKDYANRYPEIIIPFLRDTNMGGMGKRNLVDLCARAKSKYIAFCEGDDYWIDEYKLQKQFDYMESHPDCRVCTAKTRVDAPEDWHLRSWYRQTPQGDIVIPDSIPGYEEKQEYSPAEIIGMNVAHTSTHFYRWDDSVDIPDWYYEGTIGDTPLLLMQLGESNLAVLPDIVSVYRINEGSVFFNRDRETFFLKTRLDYIHYLSGLYDYAESVFDNYPLSSIRNRIKTEVANYFRALLESGEDERVASFSSQYPFAMRCFLESAVPDFFDQQSLTRRFGWSGYKVYARSKGFLKRVKPFLTAYSSCRKAKSEMRKKVRALSSIVKYWKNTFVAKDSSLWVFSGFRKNAYLDNTMYLYEYVVAHHPEIKAVWATNNRNVERSLEARDMPVVRMDSSEGEKLISKAAVAFTDHFRMSDYDSLHGLNDRLKIVQLWHGVGLKTIGDLRNTDVPGVRFSNDILPLESDGALMRLLKKVKYFFCAPNRELFEKYFLLLCPGNERILQIADPWHIPHEACFVSGHPRNIKLYSTRQAKNPVKVLYAPTYRWNPRCEKEMIRLLTESGDLIQQKMKSLNAVFTIRLHPHTWRNYKPMLSHLVREHDRIVLDGEKDIYQTLGEYSVLVSDYSSIAYDFVLINRPVVFFAFDLDEFSKRECDLNYDYEQYSPGSHVATWEDALKSIEEYIHDPSVHEDWRSSVRREFYDMSRNDERDSERLVKELKCRLGISD